MTSPRIERSAVAAQAAAPVEGRFSGTPFDTPSELPFPAAVAQRGSGRCPRAH